MVIYKYERDILIVEFHLVYDFVDVSTVFATALADPAYTKGVKLLIDERASLVFPTPQQVMSRISLLLTLRSYIDRDCVVVVSNQKHYQLAQTLSSRVNKDGLNLQAFNNFEAAKRWLTTPRANEVKWLTAKTYSNFH